MRRNIITVALFAVLSTMAVSCQKENLEELQLVTTETASARTIQYTIDGVEQIITLHGDEEWDVFVAQMMSLARQGHDVSICDTSIASHGALTKDVQTFTTTSQSEAIAWTKEMVNQGYTVDTTYKDGVYICVAIRK